jgi:hypothetical protein
MEFGFHVHHLFELKTKDYGRIKRFLEQKSGS